jgi:hypothetical protein
MCKHDLALLVVHRQEICTNQPAPTHLPELVVFIVNKGLHYDHIFYFVGINLSVFVLIDHWALVGCFPLSCCVVRLDG